VYPYEDENYFESHAARPVYNTIFYPMRWFVANGSSFNAKHVKVHHGRLKQVEVREDDKEMRSAQIEAFNGSEIHIGFTGSQRILTTFDEVTPGKFVKMTFGVALSKTSDSFINRLLEIEVIQLIDDPRIEFENGSAEEQQQIHQLFDALTGKSKVCADNFIKNYQDLVLKHCEQAGYAEDIGGGCYHILRGSLHLGVLKQALKVCEEDQVN
uniref:hypothetical protein n=1 Tax=Undibacterium sp. TaxID=1914977 RepID=UPI0037502B21